MKQKDSTMGFLKNPSKQLAPLKSSFKNKQANQNHKQINNTLFKNQNLYERLDQQLKRQIKLTNNVLVDMQNKNIYLPGYLRMKIKNFTQINLENLDAQINASLIFNIYYGLILQFLQNQSIFYQNKSQNSDQTKANFYNQNQQRIVDALSRQIILNFPRDDAILLSQKTQEKRNLQTKVTHQKNALQFKYTVRKLFHLYLEGQLFWSPLQIIHSIIQITIQPVDIILLRSDRSEQKWTIKINLMDNPTTSVKISYGDELSFSNYTLIKRKLAAFYSNHRVSQSAQFYMGFAQRNKHLSDKPKIQAQKYLEISKKQSDLIPSISYNQAKIIMEAIYKIKQINLNKKIASNERVDQIENIQEMMINQTQKKLKQKKNKKQKPKIEYFQHAHFNIPLYKDPLASIVTIFLPLGLLALINLGIFFQDSGLGSRIGSISALMIAFVAFIPTIRQQIPPNPHIIFIQIVIYLQTSTSLLVLLHSMNVKGMSDFNFLWQDSGQYLSSVIISIGCCIPVCYQIIYHYTYRLRLFQTEPEGDLLNRINSCYKNLQYQNLNASSKKNNKDSGKFNRDQWNSEDCDTYFKGYYTPYLLKENMKPNQKSKKIDLLFLLKPNQKKEKAKQQPYNTIIQFPKMRVQQFQVNQINLL